MPFRDVSAAASPPHTRCKSPDPVIMQSFYRCVRTTRAPKRPCSHRTYVALFLSLLCVVSSANGQNSATRNIALGRWVGGFDDDTVQFTVTFGGDTSTGFTLDAPLEGINRLRGRYTSQAPTRVTGRSPLHLSLGPEAGRRWRFEGELVGDTIAVGEASLLDGTSRPFRLFHILPADTVLERDAEGTYQLEPGRVVHLAPVDAFGIPSLVYLDDATGRIGQLRAVGQSRYVAGRTTFTDYPIDVQVEFTRDARGKVRGLRWRSAGGDLLSAPKISQYRTDVVRFHSDSATLEGTVYAPLTPGRHPGVVFVHGSGPADRRLYAPYAQYLARHGIVALVYDKRGSGRSTGGDWKRATFDMLANDALTAVEVLRRRPDVDSAFVGIHGSSQGGWIGPLAASLSRDVGFVIMQSGAGVSPAEQEIFRITSAVRLNGGSPAAVEGTRTAWEKLFAYIRDQGGAAALDSALAAAKISAPPGTELPPASDRALSGTRWYLSLNPFLDAEDVLRRVHVPLLAVYGERDMFVPVDRSINAIRHAASAGGNPAVDIYVFPGASHSLTNALTGGQGDVYLVNRYAPGFLPLLWQWIIARADERRLAGRTHLSTR